MKSSNQPLHRKKQYLNISTLVAAALGVLVAFTGSLQAQDVDPPEFVSAEALPDLVTINVTFSEPIVNDSVARDTFNWLIFDSTGYVLDDLLAQQQGADAVAACHPRRSARLARKIHDRQRQWPLPSRRPFGPPQDEADLPQYYKDFLTLRSRRSRRLEGRGDRSPCHARVQFVTSKITPRNRATP